MKPIFFSLLFSICIFSFSNAQNPLVKMWDKRFGGTDGEVLYSIQQTADGGYILGGYSQSGIGGDKTQSIWGIRDYWIVKTDSLGNKQWDKDFGGTDDEQYGIIKQTTEGGYILGGHSTSGISGDKTQPSWGDFDYWIIKIDSLGNKLWDKDFGGLITDQLYSIQQTADGGYILGGISSSGIGGDKTQNCWGSRDYWIVKTDSLGNKQWDKDFGGIDDDRLIAIEQTSDGGYILGGWSTSGISGDKTQNTVGSEDYWIIKTDSLGIKQWDRDFGGVGSEYFSAIKQSTDGGYIFSGFSTSDISGDKTQPLWGATGDIDFWIVKVDSNGNKIWDKDFGGMDGDECIGNISQTHDGGYLFAGTSYSPIGGNKTEANLGLEQTWIIKTDSLYNISWDKTLHTSGHDEWGQAIPTRDGCYLMANWTDAGIIGDKSQSSQGSLDYWIIKFCETLQANFTSYPFICPGTCVDFINLSFQATSYQWNFFGASPDTSTDINPANICYATPGIYDVQLIASNANGSDTLTLQNYITVFPQPPAQSITQSDDTLFAIAGSSSYQWYFNGNIIPGATDYFYVATTSGDYNVVATDSNGCEVEAVINNVAASIQYTVDSRQLTAFPNPVTNTLDIRGLNKNSADEIKIFNVFGEEVFSAVHSQFPITNFQLPSGIYYIEITSDKNIYRAKFIKQ